MLFRSAVIGLIVNTISVFSIKELPEEELKAGKDHTEEKYGLVEAAAAFDLSVHLVPLTDEEYENTALAEFQNGYLLCSGSMKDNKILVKGARRSTDIEMDLGRMEKIEQGILKLS